MADTKISALTAAGSFLLADELPVNEAGTSKKVTGSQILTAIAPTSQQLQPGNPASRTGAAVMMGLGTTATFSSPLFTRVLVLLSGDAANSIVLDGITVRLYVGGGTPPANAAAVTGTAITVTKSYTSATAAAKVGFSLQGVITGLTINTTYWVDCAVGNITGGAASIADIDITVVLF